MNVFFHAVHDFGLIQRNGKGILKDRTVKLLEPGGKVFVVLGLNGFGIQRINRSNDFEWLYR